MRVLVATDAWHPQVNGVVRTLTSLAQSARGLGVEVEFLSPDGFRTVPLPSYPQLRLAVPSPGKIARRIEAVSPDAIHLATEGPIGWAVRRYCLKHRLPFTTCYATRFPEYIAARWAVPESWSYAVLRRFHAPAAVTMVSTNSLRDDLAGRGFAHLGMWTRGVDTSMFAPEKARALDLPRPIFLTAGRVAVEKNLEAFLSLDLPGSKVVVGEGPQEAALRKRFPDVHFAGVQHGEELASWIASADVFVFPSRTDTFGVAQLEALACGVPVAAHPVMGPKDVIGDAPVGALDEDLRRACIKALSMSRSVCRAYAEQFSWTNSARQFIGHLQGLRSRPAGASQHVSADHPVPNGTSVS